MKLDASRRVSSVRLSRELMAASSNGELLLSVSNSDSAMVCLVLEGANRLMESVDVSDGDGDGGSCAGMATEGWDGRDGSGAGVGCSTSLETGSAVATGLMSTRRAAREARSAAAV